MSSLDRRTMLRVMGVSGANGAGNATSGSPVVLWALNSNSNNQWTITAV